MKVIKSILVCFLLFVLSFVHAQQTRKYTKSLLLTNGEDTVELLLRDKLPISFFRTEKIKSLEGKLDKYTLLVIAHKKGKYSYFVSNTFQWRDSLVRHVYTQHPDSLEIVRQLGKEGKMQNIIHHVTIENH